MAAKHNDKHMTYAQSGVDIDAGNEAVKRLAPHTKSTYRPGVLSDVGGFGAMFAPDIAGMKCPVLVSGTDGVGSKLKIAFAMQKHDTIGIDCVAMNADDVVCSGAEPLFFLDYIACHKVRPEVIEQIVAGVAEGARQAGCALIGGEIAELPDLYAEDEYDLAGFCVGLVDKPSIIDGSCVEPGDVIIGLSSSGLHSNGYSLARRVLLSGEYKLDTYVEDLGKSIGEEMLVPTRIYSKPLVELAKHVQVKSISHITGGGLYENVPRVMRSGTAALIRKRSWEVPAVFELIKRLGSVEEAEMYRVFNMGIGMVVIVGPDDASAAIQLMEQRGFESQQIGEVISGERGVTITG